MSPIELPGTPYRLVSRLGHGAMGEVWRGEHMVLGRKVAVKLLAVALGERSDILDRFRLEAQTLSRVHHPNIVAVHDVGRAADGRAFLVMELLEGESLESRLKRLGPLPLPEAIRVARAALGALAAAHAEGIVHRDVKPANVHLGADGVVKLLDFGVAKVVRTRASIAPLAMPTEAGAPVGTPAYFAPEQALGGAVDHRSDVYGAGATLYSALTGTKLFPHATTLAEVIAAHVREAPVPPSRRAREALLPGLDEVVLRALAKDPAARFESAADFDAALARIESGAPEPPASPGGRARLVAACLVGLALAGLAIGANELARAAAGGAP